MGATGFLSDVGMLINVFPIAELLIKTFPTIYIYSKDQIKKSVIIAPSLAM